VLDLEDDGACGYGGADRAGIGMSKHMLLWELGGRKVNEGSCCQGKDKEFIFGLVFVLCFLCTFV
jgi:hypothetical protein